MRGRDIVEIHTYIRAPRVMSGMNDDQPSDGRR